MREFSTDDEAQLKQRHHQIVRSSSRRDVGRELYLNAPEPVAPRHIRGGGFPR